MLTNLHLKAKTLFVSALLFASSANAESKKSPIILAGWPYELDYSQVMIDDYDPIVRTMLCPSLTRLNLQKQANEVHLLKGIEVKPRLWTLFLRTDLMWWDGTGVVAEDIERYLQDVIPKIATDLSFTVPEFSIQKTPNGDVQITWKTEPEFGPYILNQAAFYKGFDEHKNLICAGEWKPIHAQGITRIVPSQSEDRFSLFLEALKDSNAAPFLKFRFGEELHPSGYKRQVEALMTCDTKLDTSHISLIAWNLKAEYTSDARFRSAMTMLLPRGAIMRAGAGGLGDLVSAPILRNHPGYNKSKLVPPYNPFKAQSILNSLGYRRSERDGFRLDPQGRPIELKIYVKDFEGSTLLRKVLDDSFRALGFRIVFTDRPDSSVHGFLVVTKSKWPDGGLNDLLLDRRKRSGWVWAYDKPEVMASVMAYNLSLTTARPDFRLLERIHDQVAEEEYFSVLMQHRICLDSRDRQGKKVQLAAINQRNPDWLISIFESLDRSK